ncbi:MAG: M48 family metallopeptidase [Muribaculaceae bacterium]|nr:M48 family metallopeptidase [Muribaculaceae bacterium]
MGNIREPTYKINPNFRLKSKYLSVDWYLVDDYTLECESAIEFQGRSLFSVKQKPVILAQYSEAQLDLIYCPATDFESKKIQKWLRDLLRDVILNTAKQILPDRVKYWENIKGLKGSGVTVRRLRKNILGQCSHSNHITLQPFLVIFKEEWMDGVILHEMAHYKYKHHRKSFWDFLSKLIGEDSKLAKVKHDIALSPYYGYYLYLTKNK